MWQVLGLNHIADILRDKHVDIETYDGQTLSLKTSLYIDGDIVTQTVSTQISPVLLNKHQQNLGRAEAQMQANIKRAVNLARIFLFSFMIGVAVILGKVNEVGDEIIKMIAWNIIHLFAGGFISWIGGILLERFIRSKLGKIV